MLAVLLLPLWKLVDVVPLGAVCVVVLPLVPVWLSVGGVVVKLPVWAAADPAANASTEAPIIKVRANLKL